MGYADIHAHNTKCQVQGQFYVKDTFKFFITKIWEEISTSMKTLSYNQFKKQYKRILLNS